MGSVVACFVTTTCFVTNEVVTNCAGIAFFFFLTWISVHVILYISLVCVCVRARARACLHAYVKERETDRQTETEGHTHIETERDWERKRDRDRKKSQRETETETDTERDRDTERAIVREKEREGGRESEKKHVRHIYYATKCTRCCVEWNITLKVSPHLPFISSNHTSHSIKQGHPQHTIKPHFHSVSIYL